MKYKKFECVKCGYSWLGYALKPRCRKCGSKMINVFPAVINEDYLKNLQKKAGEKEIINKFQNKKGVKKETQQNYNSLTIEPEIKNNVNLEINKNEKMVEENNEEFNENVFYGGSAMETPKEQEEVIYRCSCGGEIEKGALFCHKCGSALDIEWNKL